MVLAMATVAFGQFNPKPVYPLDEPVSMDVRSDWYGWGTSQYYTIYDPDDIYIVRLNSFGTLTAGSQITKVKFYWKATYNDDNNLEQNSDPDFNIKIYTGGNINWVSPVALVDDISTAGRNTFEASDMGTVAYTQAYSCTEEGWQEVMLTTPYTITGNEGEIWVGIECGGTTTGLINCQATPGTEWGDYLYRYETENNGEVLAIPLYYYDNAHTQITTARYCLLAYVDDGQGYRPKSDWYAEMYSPDDEATYPDETHWVMADQNTDSLYFYGGAFNMGVDSSYGFYTLDVYIDDAEPLYFVQDDSVDVEAKWYGPNYGLRWGPITLCGREDLEEFGYNLGVTPLELCFSITYHTDPAYNGYDPDLSNNSWCATYSETEGVAEQTNTLSVSPNPASTTITVENAAGSQIFVYNIAGQEVMSVENAEANETLNVSNLNAGLYIVRVVNGNEVSTAKVSIVR